MYSPAPDSSDTSVNGQCVGAGAIVVPQPVVIGREADEVVADVQVEPSVAVDVEPGGGEAGGRRGRCREQVAGHVAERAVTVVAIQHVVV